MMKEEKKKKTSSKTINTTENKTEVTKTKRVRKPLIEKIQKESDMQVIDKTVEFSLVEVIVIILITGIVVSIASGLIVYKNYDKINLGGEETPTELKEFIENYNHIKDSYVGDINDKEILDAAIEGMYNKIGDNYSMYMNQDDTETFDEQIQGEYTGVGIEIKSETDKNGKITTSINRVFTDSPAQRAGLKAGDILLKIDDIEVIDASHVADTIKKGNKESYKITYKRNGKEQTVTLVRERVSIDSVKSEVYGNVGYVKIETFSNTTYSQLKNKIISFNSSVESIIIDVRDNSGGLLSSAYDIADLFVEKGKNIYQLKDKSGKVTEYKAENEKIRNFKNIAVIVNSGSASASEVLALALKESAGATIVGSRSFGKGTVQETKSLSSGAMVKITTAYWLSPNGNSINETGITPDIEETDNNKQLTTALKVVR